MERISRHHISHAHHRRIQGSASTEYTTSHIIKKNSSTSDANEDGSPNDSEVETSWINKATQNVNEVRPDNQYHSCTIFRVPEHIRCCDVQAYVPLVVPIGCYHHDPSQKSAIQDHKWRCVRYLLSRHRSPEHARQLLDDCLSELKAWDAEVRSCYADDFPKLKAHEMAELMLLDGCFIIHLLLKHSKRGKEDGKSGEVVLEVNKETKEEGQTMTAKENREEERGGGLGSEKGVRRAQSDRKEKRKEHERRIHGYELAELELQMDKEVEEINGPFVAGLFTVHLVLYDLLKCENQIPFFVVEKLFDILKTPEDQGIDLPMWALQLFCDMHPNASKSFRTSSMDQIHHLLHLFHSSRILQPQPPQQEKAPDTTVLRWIPCATKLRQAIVKFRKKKEKGSDTTGCEWIPSATELRRAGVKFRKNKKEINFLDITFKKGRMEIPPLRVTDRTCSLFRNLIAFEQCYAKAMTYVTIYAVFMDCIIDEAKDARLLHLRGIVVNRLSTDKALADLFNKLCNQIYYSPDKNYLGKLFAEVNIYYNSKFHRWRAGLMRDYFSSPWSIISVIAAILLLLLTIEQAMFSGFTYFHPLSGS
ncbi:UPF0481 protein At3g47200-like [Elaeis guineensis]|uniref:UPF0481 protein At3g47200-like n=1 Tax=Elaeis guineensis var. tenera TaxID=51953 RepID=UPI003C6DB204